MPRIADKRPQLADVRHSGVIYQDTDVVRFMYREDYYLSRKERRQTGEGGNTAFMEQDASWEGRLREVSSMTEVIIGKQRIGPIGVERLSFNSELARFTDL